MCFPLVTVGTLPMDQRRNRARAAEETSQPQFAGQGSQTVPHGTCTSVFLEVPAPGVM